MRPRKSNNTTIIKVDREFKKYFKKLAADEDVSMLELSRQLANTTNQKDLEQQKKRKRGTGIGLF
jgi:hypothetical protein